MITDQRQIDFFKKMASELYTPMILGDYGGDNLGQLLRLTNGISEIYKHLKYNSFKKVVIYVSIDGSTLLSNVEHYRVIKSLENLSQLNGETIILEVKENGEIHFVLEFKFDFLNYRNGAIIYSFTKQTEAEVIYGKTSERKLTPIPDADSYFAIQTYKELEVALEDYSTKIARHSECVYLKKSWFDENNRIFFQSAPEHVLRDSLTQFLKMRLRNTEVRPEQIVDRSHPVDIKVTWSLASHLALLEIKWLGKSLSTLGDNITQNYSQQRALDGAKQLAEYLDENIKQAPTKTTKGYLIVFDARRGKSNPSKTTINRVDGLKYDNEEITYNPEYHKTRADFAKPVRFFLEPIME